VLVAWRLTLLVVSLVVLSMFHASNASATPLGDRDLGAVSAIDHDSQPCCEPIPSPGMECDAGSHCPIYLLFVSALFAVDDDTDRFAMLTAAFPARDRGASPFRPPR
jgi:hypothetical protein